MTPQKLNMRNYGIGLHIQEEQDEKCLLAKNQPVGANCEEIKATLCSVDSI